MSTTAMLRLKEVKHPISEATIGFRIQAAIPNKAGKAFGKPIPSFRGVYFLGETSDMSEEELPIRFEKALESIKTDLKWKGYDDAYFIK